VALIKSGRLLGAVTDLDHADVILQVGGDLERTHPVYSLRLRKAVRNHGARLHMATTDHGGLDREAMHVVPLEAGGEVAFLRRVAGGQGDERVQRIREALLSAGRGVLVLNAGAVNDLVLEAALEIVSLNTAGLRIFLLDDGPNLTGAWDSGFTPAYFPGYLPVNPAAAASRRADWGDRVPDAPGGSRQEILASIESGKTKGLILFNSGRPWTWSADVARAAEHAARKVIFDLLPGRIGQNNFLVVPTPSMAEVDGTFTTPDHRVLLLRRSVAGPDRLWHPAALLARVEKIATGRTRPGMPVDVFRDLARAGAGYAGMNYGTIRPEGLPWSPAWSEAARAGATGEGAERG
jgi:predicted molibdopterin-dependent oxidoreductase YjgC